MSGAEERGKGREREGQKRKEKGEEKENVPSAARCLAPFGSLCCSRLAGSSLPYEMCRSYNVRCGQGDYD